MFFDSVDKNGVLDNYQSPVEASEGSLRTASGDQVVRSMDGFSVSVQRLAHS